MQRADDLDSIDLLEDYVSASQVMLTMLGSTRYLSSLNCQREMRAADQFGVPLVRVHERDPTKNGGAQRTCHYPTLSLPACLPCE